MIIVKYENKYGCLEFELTETYRPVREITSKNYDTSLFFSIATGEKIALITGNDGVQLSCVYINGVLEDKMYLIHHLTASEGAVCRLLKLEFTADVSAEEELEKLNKYEAMKTMMY